MKPPIQPIAVPTSNAASPTGMLNGNFTSVKKPIRMMAITGRPIHATSHICAAGRIEMKVIEIPASVPSIAARGVSVIDMNRSSSFAATSLADRAGD